MQDYSVLWAPITSWINGPYRELAVKFVAIFVIVGALDLAISYIPAFIERRKGARFSKWVDEYNNTR